MSCCRYYRNGRVYDHEPIVAIQNINVECKALTKHDLDLIIKGLTTCLDKKLDKLNIILKNMNVYQLNNAILVNDRFNGYLELEEVVKNFNMEIKKVDIKGLRGSNYVISDKILTLLQLLSISYNWGNKLNTKDLPDNIDIDGFEFKGDKNKYDSKLIKYLKEIYNNGKLLVAEQETLVENERESITSNVKEVDKQLKEFLKSAEEEGRRNDQDIQHGTVEILYNRAKSMGYNVKKETKGTQVQLVLTRIE